MPASTDSAQAIETVIFELAVIATNATSAVTVDTKGKGPFAIVDVCHAKATATNSSAKWTALKLQHGTTTDPTNCTNIDGAVGTTETTATTAQFVLGVHNDATNMGITRFFVNLVNLERILRVEHHATASHHTAVSMIHFFRKPQASNTDSKRGVTKSCTCKAS